MAAPSVHKFRDASGGDVTRMIVKRVLATANITSYGTPVAISGSDNTVSPCADAATAMFGWCINPTATVGDTVDIIPCYPGVQALMGVKGTYNVNQINSAIALDLTSTLFTAEVDKSDADIFIFREYIAAASSMNAREMAWVEVLAAANQTAVEV